MHDIGQLEQYQSAGFILVKSGVDINQSGVDIGQLGVHIAQWESAIELSGQNFEHSRKYFTIKKITKLLISQPILNKFSFSQKTPKCLSCQGIN